jgi:hypothetical protein
MKNLQQIFTNCPAGSTVMDNGQTYVYAGDKSQMSNYTSFGFRVTPQPVEAPKEAEAVDDGPLTSADVTANEAVAMIKENDVQFLEGFVSPGEARKSVLKAVEAKQAEPIKTVD